METPLKMTVNWALCDGNGVCAVEAPEIFELDDDDNLIVLQETIGPELKDKAERSVRVCPKHALSLQP